MKQFQFVINFENVPDDAPMAVVLSLAAQLICDPEQAPADKFPENGTVYSWTMHEIKRERRQ